MALEDQDFKTKIKSLTNEMNLFKSELTKVESQYIGQQNTLAALTAKYGVYEKMLANLNDRIRTYSEQNEKLSKVLVEVQTEREKQTQSLDEYKKKLEEVKTATETYPKILQRTIQTWKESKDEYKNAKNALAEFENKYTGTTRNFPWYKQKHEELTKAVKDAWEKQKHWGNEVKETADTLGRWNKRGDEYAAKIKEIEGDIISLDNQERDLTKAMNDNEAAMNRTQAQANKASITMAQLSEGIEDCGNSLDDTTNKFDPITGKMKETDEAARALAEAMAYQLVQKGFNVIKEAITDSIDSFKEYETALAGVSKTTGMEWGGEEIKALGDDFKALSQQMPVSAKELLNVAQIAGQLGITGSENIQKFTTVMAQMSVSTNLSAEEAATALAQMASVTGMAADDYDKLGSAIVSLGNKYPVAEDTIVRIAQRFSGAAVNANLAEGSIVALAAAAGSVGLQAESAGTSLTKLVTKMGDAVQSGEGLETWARVANMSAEDFAKLWGDDAPQAIARFLNGFGQLGDQASVTFGQLGIGEARLQDLIRRMANAEASSGLLTNALKDANVAFKDGTALAQEATVVYETLESKLGVLNNTVDVLGIEVGTVLEPQLSAATTAGTNILQQVVIPLVEKCPELVYALEGITVVLGGLALKALPQSFESFKKLSEGIKLLGENMSKTGIARGFTEIGLSATGTTIAISALIAAFVALAAWENRHYKSVKEGVVESNQATRDYIGTLSTRTELEAELDKQLQVLKDLQKQQTDEIVANGEATAETNAKIDDQCALITWLRELILGFDEATDDATESEKTFSSAMSEADEKIKQLTASFRENIAAVTDFSTEYKATAQDYIDEINQQIKWNDTYAENREKLLSRDIKGLDKWVASWDDGTAEAAKKMAAFANASDEDIRAIIDAMGRLTKAQDNNAKSFESSLASMEQSAKVHIQAIQSSLNGLKDKTVYVRVQQIGSPTVGNGQYLAVNAQGLDYVPYDGFVSMLHEGEKVLNRAEASAYRKLERTTNNNTTNNSNITLNVYGTKGQSADEISNIVMRKIQNATNRKQAVWA